LKEERPLSVSNPVHLASAIDLSTSQCLLHTFTVSIVSCKFSPSFRDSTNLQNAGLYLDYFLQITQNLLRSETETLCSLSTNYMFFPPDY